VSYAKHDDDERTELCDPDKLIALMRAGEMAALDRITRCYGERLIAVGVRRCGSRELAQDAVQDAMLSVGENMQSFRGDGSLEGWLARIVANACHRMRRGKKNDSEAHKPGEHLDGVGADGPSPEAETARGELLEALGAALVDLSPVDRTIVLLADGEGWKGPEIAAAVDLTHNAVRLRLSRGRKRLREALLEAQARVEDPS
jgi:RNA polymerase sigma factor (sigma-70 family)